MYYNIGEVAAAFHVNTSLIRFWEREFDQLKPKKNGRGMRKFSRKDVELIRTIHHLVKGRGFTLEGAREYLRNSRGEMDNMEVLNRLEYVRRELLKMKNNL